MITLNSFLFGAIVGVLAVVIILMFLQTLGRWIGQRDAFYKPQKVIHTTNKTPAQIYKKSQAADALLTVVKVACVIAGWVGIAYSSPDFAATVYDLLRQLLQILIKIMILFLQGGSQLLGN